MITLLLNNTDTLLSPITGYSQSMSLFQRLVNTAATLGYIAMRAFNSAPKTVAMLQVKI